VYKAKLFSAALSRVRSVKLVEPISAFVSTVISYPRARDPGDSAGRRSAGSSRGP